jgi:Ca2+-binding RTX toxin-like protein
MRRPGRIALLGAAVLIVAGLAPALTASNPVPATNLGQTSTPVSPNDLKPLACAGLDLTSVTGPNGDNANNLVLGTVRGQVLHGHKGDDCILGGAGDDSLRGDQDTDVCIGGPGVDSFDSSCETQIQ